MSNGPKMPELRTDQIHVWSANIEVAGARLKELSATLSADELERARRFHFARDRRRFVVARGILRELLGCYLATTPKNLVFLYNEFGKPSLMAPSGALRFNLSHSGQLAVFAIAEEREVGVDVEEIIPDRAEGRVAEQFFSTQEVTRLNALPASLRSAAFFNCWTRKEAYIKARGMGLSIPLDSFDVAFAPGEPAALLRTAEASDLTRWRLCELDLGSGYTGALAGSGSDWALVQDVYPRRKPFSLESTRLPQR